jgi:hypothetical protein
MKAMSKEEKIKEEWDKLLPFKPKGGYNIIDGFSNQLYHQIQEPIDYSFFDYEQVTINSGKIRPKSLQGIENNRGWIKIESESDLPTCDGEYFVNAKGINNNKQFFIRSWLNAKKDFNDNWVFTEYPKEWLELYSHYQPITKPKPPIY